MAAPDRTSAAGGHPPAPPSRHRHPGVVGPLLLVLLGSLFFLQNVGVLPPDVWVNLWRLWPLILVLVGIELLLGHRASWRVLVGLAVLVVGLGVGAALSFGRPAGPSGAKEQRTPDVSLGGANQADVTLRFGAGQLMVGPLDDGRPEQLAAASYQGPRGLSPEPQYSVTNGVGRLDYELRDHGRDRSWAGGPFPWLGPGSGAARMDVSLAPRVPLTLNVQTGATDARLDLSRLQVSSLDLAMGAASSWVRLPETTETTSVHVTGGVGSLTVEVPAGVAARIRHRGGLNTLSIDQTRFPPVGEQVYQSPDFDTAQHRADVVIETGVTTVRVS